MAPFHGVPGKLAGVAALEGEGIRYPAFPANKDFCVE